MKIPGWKEYAELIALVAVIGTLIAVVYELNQTRAALQAQTYQERAFDAIDFQFRVAQDEVMNILAESDPDPEDLSPEEFAAMKRLYLAIRIDLDNEHYQYENGFLDESFYFGSTATEIKAFAPRWRKFGIVEPRESFRAAVAEILSDDSIGAPSF